MTNHCWRAEWDSNLTTSRCAAGCASLSTFRPYKEPKPGSFLRLAPSALLEGAIQFIRITDTCRKEVETASAFRRDAAYYATRLRGTKLYPWLRLRIPRSIISRLLRN